MAAESPIFDDFDEYCGHHKITPDEAPAAFAAWLHAATDGGWDGKMTEAAPPSSDLEPTAEYIDHARRSGPPRNNAAILAGATALALIAFLLGYAAAGGVG